MGNIPPVLMARWWYANPGKMELFIPWRFAGKKPECSCREGQVAIMELQFCPQKKTLHSRCFAFVALSIWGTHTHTLFCAKKKMFCLLIKQQIHRSTGVVPVFLPPPSTKKTGSKPYITTKHLRFNGVRDLPSRELTYPPKMAFWRWFSFSQGGIC